MSTRYKLLAPLASPGPCPVFRAWDHQQNRDVAYLRLGAVAGDPAEVADLYHFIVAKQHLFRAERRDAVGNAVNRLLEGSLMRLQIYIKIISRPGPDEDWAVVSGTDISPDEPNASIAEAELEPIS